jgi:hypothetical protein
MLLCCNQVFVVEEREKEQEEQEEQEEEKGKFPNRSF